MQRALAARPEALAGSIDVRLTSPPVDPGFLSPSSCSLGSIAAIFVSDGFEYGLIHSFCYGILTFSRGKLRSGSNLQRGINLDASSNQPFGIEMADNQLPKIMTVKEVSEYLRVHPSTVYKLVKNGGMPAFRVGSDWRFASEVIDRWLDKLSSR